MRRILAGIYLILLIGHLIFKLVEQSFQNDRFNERPLFQQHLIGSDKGSGSVFLRTL